MSDECTRLSQFLHNILDSGAIERDVMNYALEDADMRVVVEDMYVILNPLTTGDVFTITF